jgi:hypothetical protein
VIDGRDQSLLDALPSEDAAARLRAVTALDLVGTGRAREYCSSVLRVLSRANVKHLALHYPGDASRRQFAADMIIRYVRSAGVGAKALIFLREEDLDEEQSVPSYVAQKVDARQLVLGSDLKKTRSKLLADASRAGFEIVDRTPRSTRE